MCIIKTGDNGTNMHKRKEQMSSFLVIDYEFSIIDHHNTLKIDQLSALADDRPITSSQVIDLFRVIDQICLGLTSDRSDLFRVDKQ